MNFLKKYGKWLLIGVIVLTIVALVAVVILGNTGFDRYIKEFQTGGGKTKSLEVGDTLRPSESVWIHDSGKCYSSDPDVVIVDKKGNILAIGPGDAYVVFMGVGDMHKVYHYVVTGAPISAQGHGSTTSSKFESNLKAGLNWGQASMRDVMRYVIIALCLWLTIRGGQFAILVWKLRSKANEENAAALANMLKGSSRFTKILIYSNMRKFGVRYDLLREVFNRQVNPDPNIRRETKAELYAQLQSLKVYGLDQAKH